ncbi:hypothetical protein ASE51_07010 [Bacillus sp. Root147]|jgi:hypothetical protein|nr:hypothetical protein ASE51_07010 [Bacillus sp. Root147]
MRGGTTPKTEKSFEFKVVKGLVRIIFNDHRAFRKNSGANQIISDKKREILDLHVVRLVQILHHLLGLGEVHLLFPAYRY